MQTRRSSIFDISHSKERMSFHAMG